MKEELILRFTTSFYCDEKNLLKNIIVKECKKKKNPHSIYIWKLHNYWVAKMGEMSIFVSLKNEAFHQNVWLVA